MTEVPIIDQTISAVAPVLHRDTINPTIPATQDAFVQSAEAFFDKISDTTVNEVNQVTTKIDATVSAINIVSNEISTAAIVVQQAKQITIDAKEATIIAKNAAQSIYDNFDDRYLGTKATPPTVDNDGDPLKQGALYCRESINPKENGLMYVYDKLLGNWVNITFVPTLLSSLTDVFFSGLANNDVLQYDSATGKWANRSFYSKAELDTFIDIHSKTAKATPVDADEIMIADSALTWSLKKITWANIKTALGSLFVSKVTSTDNAIVRFDGATGAVQNSNVIIDDNGNVGVGKPTPASKLHVQGNIRTDCSSLDAVNTRGIIFGIDGNIYGRLAIDNTANLLFFGSGFGYGTGSGGTVTQLTSKSTAVALNKPSGRIIMNNDALAAGASVTFTLFNNLLSAQDTLCMSMEWNSTTSYRFEQAAVGVGSTLIRVTNISGSSLSEALQIRFNVFKGANS